MIEQKLRASSKNKLFFVDELEVVGVEVESESRFKAGEAPLIYLRPLSALSPSSNPATSSQEALKPANSRRRRSQCVFTNTATRMHVLQGIPARSHQCKPTQPHIANKSLIGVSSAWSYQAKQSPPSSSCHTTQALRMPA